jgi:hypothetical protein
MALYDPQALKISRISKGTPYCFRYRLRDDALQISVKRFGILMPIVVTNAERPVVIAGHKRFYAAQALKMKEVPALVAKKISLKDAFLLNLVSNWRWIAHRRLRWRSGIFILMKTRSFQP